MLKKKIARVPPLQNGGFFKNFGHFLAKFGQNRILRWWNNGTLHVVRVSNVFSKNSAFSMLKEGNRVRFQMGQTSSAHSTLRRRFFFAFFCWTAEHSEFSVERRETSERTSFSQHWEGAFRFCGTEGAFACVVEDVSKYWYSPSAFWTFGESGAKDSFSGSLSAGVFSCVRWGPVLGPFLRYNVTNSIFKAF